MIMRLFRAERCVHVATWSNVTAMGRLFLELTSDDTVVSLPQQPTDLAESHQDTKPSKKRGAARTQSNAKVLQEPRQREENRFAQAPDDDGKSQSFEELLAELKAELCQQSIGKSDG